MPARYRGSVLDAVWAALLHPGTIAGRDSVAALALPAVVIAAVTIGFMAVAGRRAIPRSPVGAVLLGSAFAPALMIALALLAASHHPAGSDGGGILLFAAIVLAVYALPVTAAASVLYVLVRLRRAR